MSAAALRLTVFAILLLALHSAAPMSINKRQFNDGQLSLCGAHTPCGWGVYDSNTRQMDYFVRNVCQCDRPRERCLRSSDDVSISAYVYRCVRSSSSSSSASRTTATATGNNLARSGVDSSSSSLEMNLKV